MIEFDVVGTPAPQGSKRGFVNKYTGKVAMVESSSERVKSWRSDVRDAALKVAPDIAPRGPVAVRLWFRVARPRGHYGTGRNAESVKPSAPYHPAVKPDLDKIVRATLDALTGVLFADDCQVVDLTTAKRYADGERTGARIVVENLSATVGDIRG